MIRALLLLLSLVSAAHAQSVQQSGSVTPGHVAAWATNGVLQDGGTASQGVLTSIGTTGSGPTICANSGPVTGSYNEICLGATPTGGGSISLNNYNGATGGLTFTINGTTQGFGVVNLPVTAGDLACFANTSGNLLDCGSAGGSVVHGPATTVVLDIATWNNTTGTLLADAGSLVGVIGGLSVSGSSLPVNGIYLPAANTLGLSLNSTAALSISASEIQPATDNAIALGDATHRFSNFFSEQGTISGATTPQWLVKSTSTDSVVIQVQGQTHTVQLDETSAGGVLKTVTNGTLLLGTNNITRVTVAAAGNIGTGTETNPQAQLVVSANVTTGQSFVAGTVLGLVAADGTGTALDVDSYNNGTAASGGSLPFRTARGTAASPSNTVSGDLLGAISGRPYNSGFTAAGTGRIAFNYVDSGTNLGTTIELDTTPVGSTTRSQAALLGAGLTIGSVTTDPGTGHLLAANNSTVPSTSGVGEAVLQLVAANGNGTRALFDAAANTGVVTFRRADGTLASPTALAANDQIGAITNHGYNGSAYSGAQAYIAFFAAPSGANWTTGDEGTYATMDLTPSGSTTAAETVRWFGSGGVAIGSTADPGAKNLGLGGSSSGELILSAGSAAGGKATFPNNTGTVAELNLAQSWTANQTFGSSTTVTMPDSSTWTSAAVTVPTAQFIWNTARTISVNSSSTLDDLDIAAATTTLSAGILTVMGTPFNKVSLYQPTFNGTGQTIQISSAATLYIANAPTATGTASITGAAYALNIAAGNVTLGAGSLFIDSSGAVTSGDKLAVTGQATFTSTFNLTGLTSDSGVTHSRTVCQSTSGGTVNALYFGSGTGGICIGTSGEQFKHDIRPLPYGLAELRSISADTFFYNKGVMDGGDRKQVGYLAQEVAQAMPLLARFDEKGNPSAVDYMGIAVVNVKATQQLADKVDELDSRLSKLRATNDNMEAEITRLRAGR